MRRPWTAPGAGPLPQRDAAPAHADHLLHRHPGLIDAFQVFDQVFVLARPGEPIERDDHARLLHLRERIPELQDGLASGGFVGPVPDRRRADVRLLPLAAPLGALPVSRRADERGTSCPPAHEPRPRGRSRTPARHGSARRRSYVACSSSAASLMMMPFFWMIADVAQDAGRGLRVAAAVAPDRPALGELRDDVERVGRRDVRDVLPELAEDRDPEHDRRSCSPARWRRSPSPCSRSAAGGCCSGS